ncbi:hypothetical protein MRB53_037344 [Persea americana]|nr:hypothetical protein MRB53_037344 [Persea americana]
MSCVRVISRTFRDDLHGLLLGNALDLFQLLPRPCAKSASLCNMALHPRIGNGLDSVVAAFGKELNIPLRKPRDALHPSEWTRLASPALFTSSFDKCIGAPGPPGPMSSPSSWTGSSADIAVTQVAG